MDKAICQNYKIESIGQGYYHNSWSDLASIINDDSTSPAIWDMNQSDSAGKLLPASSEADEFVSFAKWAFGPTGLPNLQILDLGDFSDKDQFQKQQCLIRRRCQEKANMQAESLPQRRPVKRRRRSSGSQSSERLENGIFGTILPKFLPPQMTQVIKSLTTVIFLSNRKLR